MTNLTFAIASAAVCSCVATSLAAAEVPTSRHLTREMRGSDAEAVDPNRLIAEQQAVRDADAAFWHAFNACDAKAMAMYFSRDVEFYHDITGLTRSRVAVVQSLMKGPCGSADLKVRRELIPGSVVFNEIPNYGVLLVGQHKFYERQSDGAERAATTATFVTVWKRQAGQWLMTRVVSYDHKPIPYSPPSTRISLPSEALKRFVGSYHSSHSGDIDVSLKGGVLKLHSGGQLDVTLAASAPDQFFALERDLKFNFSETAVSFVVTVIEGGETVATGVRPK